MLNKINNLIRKCFANSSKITSDSQSCTHNISNPITQQPSPHSPLSIPTIVSTTSLSLSLSSNNYDYKKNLHNFEQQNLVPLQEENRKNSNNISSTEQNRRRKSSSNSGDHQRHFQEENKQQLAISFEQMYKDNSLYTPELSETSSTGSSSAVSGTTAVAGMRRGMDDEASSVLNTQCVSIQKLDAQIRAQFCELSEFGMIELGMDGPPVNLSMLETLYNLKMCALRNEAERELAKFDEAAGKNSEQRHLQKLKVCV